HGTIENNTIVDNVIKVARTPTDYDWKGGGLAECTGPFLNNILWMSRSDLIPEYTTSSLPKFSCIKGWNGGGEGNTNGDPRLRKMEFQDDLGLQSSKPGWDVRLRPDSPCIDSGTSAGVATDYDGKPRPIIWRTQGAHGDGSHTDMGAYEFDPGP